MAISHPAAGAQDTEDALRSLRASFEAGQYRAAEPVADALLQDIDEPDAARAADIRHAAGRLYVELARYDEAAVHLEAALESRKRLFGADHPSVADTLAVLANLRLETERYADSEALIKQALAIRQQRFGATSHIVGETLSQYGEVAAFNDRYELAEQLLVRALEILGQSAQGNEALIGEALGRLGFVRSQQERYAEAEDLLEQALSMLESALGAGHPTLGDSLFNLGANAHAQDDLAAAEAFYERAMRIDEDRRGPWHPYVAITLGELGAIYETQERHSAAKEAYQRALQIDERAFGPTHVYVADRLKTLSRLHTSLNEQTTAIALLERALAIDEGAYGALGETTAETMADLLALYLEADRTADTEAMLVRVLESRDRSGASIEPLLPMFRILAEAHKERTRHEDAERILTRALEAGESELGTDHREVIETRVELGWARFVSGNIVGAVPVLTRAKEAAERTLAPGDQLLGKIHLFLGAALAHFGQFSEAETNAKLALSHFDESKSSAYFRSAALGILALVRAKQGRLAEAEPFYRRKLALMEDVFGASDSAVIEALSELARFYIGIGRHRSAERLIERALVLSESDPDLDSTMLANLLSQAAQLRTADSRHAEAAALLQRALDLYEAKLGPRHPTVANMLLHLGTHHFRNDDFDQAETLFQRAYDIASSVLGPDHILVADIQMVRAMGLLNQDRIEDAERTAAEALSIRESAFGPDHFENFGPLAISAMIAESDGRKAEALQRIRRASAFLRSHAETTLGSAAAGDDVRYAIIPDIVLLHLGILESQSPDDAAAEAFEAVQLARAGGAASALSRMAARFSIGNDTLARLVRQRQDLFERRRSLDALLLEAAGRPSDERQTDYEATLRQERAEIETHRATLDAAMAQRFPDYAELAAPPPLTFAEAQDLLGSDEALVVFLVRRAASAVVVLRRDRARFYVVNLDADAVADAVAKLRYSLDPTQIRSADQLLDFPTETAHTLYTSLFAPAETLLKDAGHIIVVPDGALQSLPFGVLVTEAPKGAFTSLSDFRQTPWLARRFATSVLPAVSSLRALRRLARASQAREAFLGIGDPLLRNHPGAVRAGDATSSADVVDWLEASSARQPGDVRGVFRAGGEASLDTLKGLASLPETATELTSMADSFGAGPDALVLRESAVEPIVRARLSGGQHRVIAFATHALIAGELGGVLEPAVVLTPPSKATPEDDGLLTSSEIAQLKLDADWVVLSACNTAASDGTPDADGLSGLAKAFFYAGSRALFVSHWPVLSEATVRLTTYMIGELAADPAMGRAEAHRRAMLALMDDPENDLLAHPAVWAPFVVVGEGGHPAAQRPVAP